MVITAFLVVVFLGAQTVLGLKNSQFETHVDWKARKATLPTAPLAQMNRNLISGLPANATGMVQDRMRILAGAIELVKKRAQSRGGGRMKPLQDSNGAVTCDEAAFTIWAIKYFEECGTQLSAMSNYLISTSERVTGSQRREACGNGCADKFIAAIDRFSGCFDEPKQSKAGIKIWQVACEDAGDGQICGEKWGKIGVINQCSQSTRAATCGTRADCEWAPQVEACRPNPTQATMADVCHSCVLKMVAAVALGSEDASGRLLLMMFNQVICNKVQDTFCMGRVARIMFQNGTLTGSDTPSATADVLTMCGDPIDHPCFKSSLTASFSYDFAVEKDTFVTCAKYYASSPSLVERYCFRRLDYFAHIFNARMNQLQHACKKNQNKDFCLLKISELIHEHTACVAALPTCSATCNTGFEAKIDAWGCCSADINVMTTGGNTNYDLLDLPSAAQGMTPTVFDQTQEAIWSRHLMNYFSACSFAANNPNFANVHTAGCPAGTGLNKTSPDPTIRLGLRVQWNALELDSSLRQRSLRALRVDVASAMNVFTSQISSDFLSENSIVGIDTGSRRQQAAPVLTGALYTFSVNGDSDAENTAAVASWRANVGSGKFQPANLAVMLSEECQHCMQAGESSLVDPKSTDGASVSGATSFSVSLAMVVVAVVVAVLF